MTVPLPAALRAAADGICTLEAAAGATIAHGTWLARGDFRCFIHHGTGIGEAITGIDDHNIGLLVKAVLHASGRRQFPASSGVRGLLNELRVCR